jgi:hypothetical protein
MCLYTDELGFNIMTVLCVLINERRNTANSVTVNSKESIGTTGYMTL